MKTLIVGSGGREHALAWALSASPVVGDLYCAPGNAGIAACAQCLDIAATDLKGILDFCQSKEIELVVVGPEQPLVMGLVDELQAIGVKAFGPNRDAAVLEGSKQFMKEFCVRHGIPTASYQTFDKSRAVDADAYIAAHEPPLVVKVDGLAAGKGVTVASTREQARAAVNEAFSGRFGPAGNNVIIEECLVGEEVSLFAICDGQVALEIGTAQDHKRAFDGDKGPNTGGMGAYSPSPLLDAATIELVMQTIIRPTLAGMAAENRPFRGFLYAGLMMTEAGPKLLEYNVRFGDPECQVVLPRLMTDLGQLIIGACDGVLDHMDLRWYDEQALTVVIANQGYPGNYEKDSVLGGLDALDDQEDLHIFHAGTKQQGDLILASGGRVLNVTGVGKSLKDAHRKAYDAVAVVEWPKGFYRKDIGWRAL